MLLSTVSRPVCLGVKHSYGAKYHIFYNCQRVAGLLMCGAHSYKRTDRLFTIAVGLASAVILGSDFHGTHDHILLSQI
jgi:hypothetical protein